MDTQTLAEPPGVFKLIGHTVRWNLVRVLARSDYCVQDLVDRLNLPQNLVSYHLRQLREGHLVTERRSSADERSSYYSLDLEQLHLFYRRAGETLHPAVIEDMASSPRIQRLPALSLPPSRILFLCTENSARSQMAEALLRHLSDGAIAAFSAGSAPAPHIHPFALRVMEAVGIDMSLQYPKHLIEFRGQHFDIVVTVCDRVLEVCPTFPDDPERVHWSFLDPATVAPERQYRAFEQTSLQLTTRIRFLLTLLQHKKG